LIAIEDRKISKEFYCLNFHSVYSLNFGPYDIMALQHLYGKNTSFRAGDTLYKFCADCITDVNKEADVISIDFNQLQSFTLYDAGGLNTLDLSAVNQSHIIDIRPLTDPFIYNINIIGHNYFWLMGNITKVISSDWPINLYAAREIEHVFDITSKEGSVFLDPGEHGQSFYIQPKDVGKLCIFGFQPNDKLYLAKELFQNKDDVFKAVFFSQPIRENILLFEQRIYFQDLLSKKLDYSSIEYYSGEDMDGHVKLCLNAGCAHQVNLFYHDEFFSEAFTSENIELF
jgi:hypothetical protein